ncbi:MAG TPA: NAD/NADP octopine/nopaline dehydrogenase family protein, partial [Myxococcota bacterium]|nr:NAD/NADP octopine/nopaline dehydrogenase family protein [Myxococcota bacterium]
MIRLRTVRFPRSNEGPVGIVGGGNSAHALAAYLAQRGYAPHLFVRTPRKIAAVATTKLLRATGAIDGLFAVPMVTSSMEELLSICPTVFVCTVATAYRDVARQMAPYLTSAHEIIVFSSKLFGSLELARAIDAHGGAQPDLIAETDALFAARLQDDGSVHVRGIKKWNLAATPAAEDMERGVALLQRFFPQVERAANLVQRGLTDFGALVHPLTVLVNANRVDRGESFLFYMDGFTPRTAALIEALEAEFRSIAGAYGSSLISAR